MRHNRSEYRALTARFKIYRHGEHIARKLNMVLNLVCATRSVQLRVAAGVSIQDPTTRTSAKVGLTSTMGISPTTSRS